MNNIIFSPSSIADLYKNHLVMDQDFSTEQNVASAPAQATSAKPVEKPKDGYVMVGANKKKISIIIKATDTYAVPDDHLQFLVNILKACKLSLEDVAIINHNSKAVQIQKLKEELAPTTVLLFGVNPVDISLPINFPHFKMQSYDSITYLYSPDLSDINKESEEGKLLKSKLWLSLRQLFQI